MLSSQRFCVERVLVLALIALLALPPAAVAQAPAAQGQMVQSLKVIPLAGHRESNDLERKIMAPLVVQVLDPNARPVEGADVVFRFPSSGPGASFANEQKSQTFRTNAEGQAAATGWAANSQVGTFQVIVSATRGSDVGETIISMTNTPRVVADVVQRKGWWSSKWTKIAIVAGAAGAVTAIILLRRDSDAPATISASPGAPTIGGPQ